MQKSIPGYSWIYLNLASKVTFIGTKDRFLFIDAQQNSPNLQSYRSISFDLG